jgi:hypothetical protein
MTVVPHLIDDMPSLWAEEEYRRLEVSDLPEVIASFVRYYDALADGHAPTWESFDIIEAPNASVRYICKCIGEFAHPDDRFPIFFRYTLIGSGAEWLVGPGLEGKRVGYVMNTTCRNSLLAEITEMLETGAPTLVSARLNITGCPDTSFVRCLFPFRDTKGRHTHLILLLMNSQQ